MKRVVLTSSFAAIGYGHGPRSEPYDETSWTDLDGNGLTAILIIKRLLDGSVPGCPQRWFGAVDVRDLADLHVRAMSHPAAKGERFLAVSGDFMPMIQFARILKERLGDRRDR